MATIPPNTTPNIHLIRSALSAAMAALVSCRSASIPAWVSCRSACTSDWCTWAEQSPRAPPCTQASVAVATSPYSGFPGQCLAELVSGVVPSIAGEEMVPDIPAGAGDLDELEMPGPRSGMKPVRDGPKFGGIVHAVDGTFPPHELECSNVVPSATLSTYVYKPHNSRRQRIPAPPLFRADRTHLRLPDHHGRLVESRRHASVK